MKTKHFLRIAAAFALIVAFGLSAAANTPAYMLPHTPGTEQGDANGDGRITAEDARLALRFAVGLEESLPSAYASVGYFADCDGDTRVTADDARLILRRAVGLDGYVPPRADHGMYHIRLNGIYNDFGTLGESALNKERSTGTSGRDRLLWKLSSVAEREAWVDAFRQFDGNNEKACAFLERYDESFFEARDLFVCFCVENSGSYTQAVYWPTLQNGVLTFRVSTAYIEGAPVTCDMAYWLVFIPRVRNAADSITGYTCIKGDETAMPREQFYK